MLSKVKMNNLTPPCFHKKNFTTREGFEKTYIKIYIGLFLIFFLVHKDATTQPRMKHSQKPAGRQVLSKMLLVSSVGNNKLQSVWMAQIQQRWSNLESNITMKGRYFLWVCCREFICDGEKLAQQGWTWWQSYAVESSSVTLGFGEFEASLNSSSSFSML